MGDPVYLYLYSDFRPGWVGQGWFSGSFDIIPAVGLRWIPAVEKAKVWLGRKVMDRDRGWWAMADVSGLTQYGRYGEMTSSNVYGTSILVNGQLSPYTPMQWA